MLFALAAFGAIVHRALRCLTVVVLASAPSVCAAILTYDISRSLGYAFPAFFVAMAAMRQSFHTRDLRRVLMVATVCSVLFPTYFVVFGQISTLLPIFRLL